MHIILTSSYSLRWKYKFEKFAYNPARFGREFNFSNLEIISFAELNVFSAALNSQYIVSAKIRLKHKEMC